MSETPSNGDSGEAVPGEASSVLLSGLVSTLESSVLGHSCDQFNAWLRVDAADWLQLAELCRNDFGCSYFSFLSGMDWLPNPALDGEKAFTENYTPETPAIIEDPAIRRGGGTSRFQVIGRLYNPETHEGITLSADLDDEAPSVASWTPVYRGADWHEREAWEMFGFEFVGHPGLRNIYLPAEFVGHPLRKDYALVSRIVRPWPGLVDMEDIPNTGEDKATKPARRAKAANDE